MTLVTDSAEEGAANSGLTLTATEHFLFSLDAFFATDIGVANLEPLGVVAILTGVRSVLLFSAFLLLKNFFGVFLFVLEELMGM